MSDKDLCIDHYDFTEMLALYTCPFDYTDYHILEARKTPMTLRKDDVDEEIVVFYEKVLIILECVYLFRDNQKKITNHYLPNTADDTIIVNTIKQIPNYHNYKDTSALIDLVIEKTPQFNKFSKLTADAKAEQEKREKTIVTEQAKQFVNVHQNDVVAGTINPAKRITNTMNIHLNSTFREKYYTTNPCNYTYTLPYEIKNVMAMRLASIEIPNSWYLFSHKKKNNQFKIEITQHKKCHVFIIVIPDGNYTNESLTNYLNTTYFCERNDESLLKNLKITINPYNHKTIIEIVNEETPIVFSLHFVIEDNDNIMNTLGWILGFRLARYIKIDDAIQSEGMYDGGGDRYVYFCLNDYQYSRNDQNVVCFEDTSMDENILGKIPMMNGKLSMVIDENDGCSLTKTRTYNGPVNLRKLSIRVIDKFGDIIDLNHMDFSFTLEMEILYEKNRVVL
tara:strand:- start:1677 stop:3026 length:1350 start_codon:yes stop_codon:yes gene_type:complete